jgi:hypothetical protein
MVDDATALAEKEKRRKKQAKRMGKVLSKAWQLPDSDSFQDDKKQASSSAVLCLGAIGTRIDGESYRLGRHGWEDFARDLGGGKLQRVSMKWMSCGMAWGSVESFVSEKIPSERSFKR